MGYWWRLCLCDIYALWLGGGAIDGAGAIKGGDTVYAIFLLYISLQTKVMAKKLADRGNLKRLVRVGVCVSMGVGWGQGALVSFDTWHMRQGVYRGSKEAFMYTQELRNDVLNQKSYWPIIISSLLFFYKLLGTSWLPCMCMQDLKCWLMFCSSMGQKSHILVILLRFVLDCHYFHPNVKRILGNSYYRIFPYIGRPRV